MTHHTPAPNSWRRWAIGLGLVALLIAVYFLTYRGYAISRDEWFLFDATESMARRGTLEQNYEFDAFPPISLDTVNPPPADTEPLQPVLASTLFLIAQALPGIGLAHTVWLFNVLITALTGGVVYAYGIGLGYRARVSALVAIIYGLGTIAWPYSRTYFREPLFTLLALLTVYLVMIVRQRLTAGERPILAGIGLALAFTGALFSKEVSLLLIPAIIIEALPSRLKHIRFTRRAAITLIGIAIFLGILGIAILNADTLFNISRRYAFTTRLEQARANLSGATEGIKGYMISPGRSMWLFSPALLLGFFGWRRLAREGRWRQIAVPLTVLVTFVIGYAVVRGENQWAGGLGWGARYLVPVIPFVALWLLPVIASLVERRAAWWQRLAALAIFLVSAGIQVLASLVSIQRYYDSLTEQERFAYDDIWVFNKSPIPGYLDLVGDRDVDWAWQYAASGSWLLPALCAVLAAVALGWIIWWVRRPDHVPSARYPFALTAGSLALVTAITLGGGLYAIRQDVRYSGDFQPTLDLLYQLKSELEPDDVIVLNDPTYAEFFMNYYKLDAPTVYTLPTAPGERSSPEQAPTLVSAYPDELVHPAETLLLAHYAQQTDRLWLVINSSRFIPWSTRPVEYYLARHYFPVREIAPSDLARAVLFDMTPAPPATATSWPEYAADAVYDVTIQLVGYDIPGGTTRQAGDVLPVSLLWQALDTVPKDYTVALFLVAPDETLVAQHDAFPAYYFDPTSAWRPGSLHRDNHGMPLPDSLPSGEYELWAALYHWETPSERLPVTRENGESIGDHAVLVTITVQNPSP